jgi:DNA-binding transcriptional LysR family regulator
MDTLLNMRAVLAVSETGSLSGAARKLNVATSVISKRLGRLEDELGAPLFVRTPRRANVTAFAERQLPRIRALVHEIDGMVSNARRGRQSLDGHLRIKCPTTVANGFFGRFFWDFLERHDNVTIDLVMVDRSVNPIDEGFDLALGAMPASYSDVTDFPLCEYPLILCASPAYLARHGTPDHPGDLMQHRCLASLSIGNDWVFRSECGDLSVQVPSRFSVNDVTVLKNAACSGGGIVLISEFVARSAIKSGALVPLLPRYPARGLWLKALVPTARLNDPLNRALMEDLIGFTQPIAPWDRADYPG